MATALFLLDTALNALMLMLAVRLGGERLRACRVLAGAALGAAVAAAARGLALTRAQTAALWFPTALLMMTAANGWRAMGRPIRSVMLLLCAAGLLGGTVLSLYGATGSLGIAYALGGACTLALAVSALRAGRTARSVQRAALTCRYKGRTATFGAMIDSGNTLRDYLTGLPVIVMPQEAARRGFRLDEQPLRPIFADTAGGRQMMSVLAPQEVIVSAGGETRRVQAVIALSPAMRADALALVPATLTMEMEGVLKIKSRGGHGHGTGENMGDKAADDAPGAGDHPPGGNGRLYRRQRFAAGSADKGRGKRALCAHDGGAQQRTQDAH